MQVKILPKSQEQIMLDMIAQGKQYALYKMGNFSNQLVWNNTTYIFNSDRKRSIFKEGLFIFSMVKRDVLKFLQRKKDIENKKKYPTNVIVDEAAEDNRKITATDLNHAYWRIAYNLGYISKNTYMKGLTIPNKALRLAALSTLGRDKDYRVIRNGKLTKETKTVKGDKQLQVIYNNIRNTCFYHMNEAARILGGDFIAYKTDCIYYFDNPANRTKVQSYFKKVNINFKQTELPEAVN